MGVDLATHGLTLLGAAKGNELFWPLSNDLLLRARKPHFQEEGWGIPYLTGILVKGADMRIVSQPIGS